MASKMLQFEDLTHDAVRHVSLFLTMEEYTRLAVTSQSVRSALQDDFDLRRPYFYMRDSSEWPSTLREVQAANSDQRGSAFGTAVYTDELCRDIQVHGAHAFQRLGPRAWTDRRSIPHEVFFGEGIFLWRFRSAIVWNGEQHHVCWKRLIVDRLTQAKTVEELWLLKASAVEGSRVVDADVADNDRYLRDYVDRLFPVLPVL
jgi:hypothetical protein